MTGAAGVAIVGTGGMGREAAARISAMRGGDSVRGFLDAGSA